MKFPLTPVYAPVGFSDVDTPLPRLVSPGLPMQRNLQPAQSKPIETRIFFDIDTL
jgi:hypothetical protein